MEKNIIGIKEVLLLHPICELKKQNFLEQLYDGLNDKCE